MSIKRAVFVTNKAAETWHLGSIGFVRAVKHVRPDLLMDARSRQRYDFGNLSRASALALEPGMETWYGNNRLQAEPPKDLENDWHVIVLKNSDLEVHMEEWRRAGWIVSLFEPRLDSHPLRSSTPTEDRSNPVVVDAKIRALQKQLLDTMRRLQNLETTASEALLHIKEFGVAARLSKSRRTQRSNKRRTQQ